MTYASYPVEGGSGGGVPTYANLAAFPSAAGAGNGALAIALDTDILYISNGAAWEVLSNPSYAAAITALTGDVTATGPGSVPASLVATSNATLTTLSALTTASSLASIGTVTSGTWNATTLAINHGGTGQTSATAAFNSLNPMTTTGDLLYESGANTAARRAIGSTADVLTVSGGVPVWAPPATSGTVTSVAMTVPSLLSISGSPITDSGTLALTYSGTALPITNGGTGQTTANPAFNALSPLTTKGDLVAFSTVNARLPIGSDTQVLTADASQTLGLKWAAPATSGTVTSVAMTVPSFLSISGSPVTNSGTLAVSLSGTALPVANGGTGVTTSTGTTAVVLSTSPTLVTPLLGTPTSGTLSNCTGLPIGGGTTGTLGADRGGTGIANNASSTLTISGNFATTLTVSGITSVTLPTSGTLANLTGSQVLTNKDLTATTNSFTAYNPAISGGTTGVVSGTSGLKGFTDNSAGPAGYLGEYMESTTSSVAVTDGNYHDAGSLSLTAGDWDVTINIYFSAGGGVYVDCDAGISTTTGNSSSGLVAGNNLSVSSPSSGNDTSTMVPSYRVSLGSPTTYFGKVKARVSGGSPTYSSRLSARRMR